MEALSKAFALILAILLLFFYPISEAAERQDDISYTVAQKAVTQFVDSVRDKGFITPKMYNDFYDELAATGNTYDIQMERYHKKYDPVYDESNTFTGDIQVDYDGFYTKDIMDTLFPNDGKLIDDPKRMYELNVGDFFKVTVKNTNKTPATVMRDFLNNGSSDNTTMVIPYGGMVENEDYEDH